MESDDTWNGSKETGERHSRRHYSENLVLNAAHAILVRGRDSAMVHMVISNSYVKAGCSRMTAPNDSFESLRPLRGVESCGG